MTVSLEPREIILLLVVLGVAAFLLVLSYRRTQPPTGRRLRIALGGVRALAFALLALALLDPVVTLAHRREEEPSVAVLVDVSLSLSLPGRWDAVQTLLAGPGERAAKGPSPRLSPFLAEISRRARLRLLSFDAVAAEDPRGAASAGELAPRGGATDIAAALRGARQIAGRQLAAVVLVSDGRTTVGGDPLGAARELAVPVYTVLAGDATPPPDIAVVAARGPEMAYVGSRATMEAQVGAVGFRGRELALVLRDESGALDSTRVAAPADGGLAAAELHFTPRQPGAHRYTIELPPQPGEAVLANNQRHLLVTVEKERLRVLLVEPVPRWDEKFLERSLAADEGLRVEADFVGTPRGAGAEARGLQLPARGLEEADVIVLGNFPLEALGPADAEGIASAVERRGAGLLLLGGERAFRGAGEPWNRLLPVRSGGRLAPESGTFRAVLTARGVEHPVTRLAEDPTANRVLWDGLPPILARHAPLATRPGADVLLEAAPASAASVSAAGRHATAGSSPLLITARVGEGKVACLAGAGFWRWSFLMWGAGRGGEYYDRFMNHLVRWLAAREDVRRVRITPDQSIYRYGEPVRFTARVFDAALAPRAGASVEVEITGGDAAARGSAAASRSLALAGVEGAPGYYRGEIFPLAPGRYHYRCRAEAEGATLGEDAGEFEVVESSVEFEDLRPDPELLQSLAAETGGRFYRAAEAAALPATLELAPRTVRTERELRPGRSPILFGAALLLLAAEWTWRRRRGLW